MSNYVKMYEEPKFKCDRQEAERLAEQLRTNATYDQGVARWKSNGRCIPSDCAEFAAHLGLPINLEKTEAKRDQENEEFLAEYRKRNANRKYTAEEMYEMDAAFGPGQTIVNVFTGQKYITK